MNVIGWAGSLRFQPSATSTSSRRRRWWRISSPCRSRFCILVLGVGVAGSRARFRPGSRALFNNANWLARQSAARPCSASPRRCPGLPLRAAAACTRGPPARFTVLDVGAGGAIHLRTAGADWLIDCAHGYEYEQVVRPYLRARGVNSLAGLILTHGDAQHIGGALALFEDLPPR